MEPLSRVVQLRLTEAQYDELRDLADGRVPVSTLVRQIIGAALAGPESQRAGEWEELSPRAQAVLKRWAAEPVARG